MQWLNDGGSGAMVLRQRSDHCLRLSAQPRVGQQMTRYKYCVDVIHITGVLKFRAIGESIHSTIR